MQLYIFIYTFFFRNIKILLWKYREEFNLTGFFCVIQFPCSSVFLFMISRASKFSQRSRTLVFYSWSQKSFILFFHISLHRENFSLILWFPLGKTHYPWGYVCHWTRGILIIFYWRNIFFSTEVQFSFLV